MSVLAELRAGIRSILGQPIHAEPLKLLVSKAHFDKGEAWVREAYGVGGDIEIIESVPLGGREPRRYPSKAVEYARARSHGIAPDYPFSTYEHGGVVYDNPFWRGS